MTHFLKAKDLESKFTADKLKNREENEIFRSIFSDPTYPQDRKRFLSTGNFFHYMYGFSNYFPKLWRIAKLMRVRLLDTYRKREYKLDETKPILVTDECTLHKEILHFLHRHSCEGDDIVPMWEVHSNTTGIAPDSKRSSKEKIGDVRRIEDIIR